MLIDDELALKTLKMIVDRQGHDYVYPYANNLSDYQEGTTSCKYGENQDTPSCLVGHVVYEIDQTAFRDMVSRHNNDGFDRSMFPVSYAIEVALCEAQCLQDSGKTWGEAYDKAVEVYEDQK